MKTSLMNHESPGKIPEQFLVKSVVKDPKWNILLCEACEDGVVPLWELLYLQHIYGPYIFDKHKSKFTYRGQLAQYVAFYYDCSIKEAIRWIVIFESVFTFFFDETKKAMLKNQRLTDIEKYLERVSSNHAHFFPGQTFKKYL